MFQRISNSWSLAMSSWRVLQTDKQLVLFPLISALALLFVLASFAVPVGVIAANGGLMDQNNNPQIWIYPIAFLFYFCNYFVIVFCNAALTTCALARLNGETPSLGLGFSIAFSRLPQITAWALVSATVGMLLAAIENAHEKIGGIVRAILGAAWSIMTYFVVPVLVAEKLGPFDAIKRSCAILSKTWGESLVGNLGLGLLVFLLAIPGIALVVMGAVLIGNANLLVVGIIVLVLAGLYLIGLSLVSSTLQSIYLAAMYQYAANGQVAEGFDRDAFTTAFTAKA